MTFLSDLFAPELRAWRGQAPLWKVYWLYGVLASAALSLLLLAAMRDDRRLLQQGVLLGLALYTPWVLVSVWRCSAQAAPLWRTLARASSIAWACNAALVLGFLELDLIARVFFD